MAESYDHMQAEAMSVDDHPTNNIDRPYGRNQNTANLVNTAIDMGMQRVRSNMMNQQAKESLSISDAVRK